ncbi:TTAGGG repeat binding factor [Oleoguttula sp. CCFEE 5521]
MSMSIGTLLLTEVRSHFGLSAVQSRDLGELYERMNKRRRLDDGANTSYELIAGHGAWQQSQYGAQQGVAEAGNDVNSYADHTDYRQLQGTGWQQSYQPTPQYYTHSYQVGDAHRDGGAAEQNINAGCHSLWPTEAQVPGSLSSGISDMHLSMNHTSAAVRQVSQRAVAFENRTSVYSPDSFAYIDHVETQQQQQPQAQAQPQHATSYYEDVSMHLKLQSLPILDNLATQIIQNIATMSFSHLQKLAQSCGSEECQPYVALKNLFDQTRKVYLRDTPFIDAFAIHLFLPHQQDIFRKANVATLMSTVFGAHDVSLRHLDTYFLAIFVPLGQRLLKWQGAMYLELKTQAYISSLMSGQLGVEVLLNDLFGEDLESNVLSRHPDAPSLSPAEQDFIDRCRSRKTYLMAETLAPNALQELPRKYQWAEFTRELAAACSRNVDSLLNASPHAQMTTDPLKISGVSSSGAQERHHTTYAARSQRKLASPQRGSNTATPSTSKALASLPERSQSSSSKDAPVSTSGNATRQPWTKPEEEALVAGLEQVDGPHWSQILALYGRGGSRSEALKDRNQVQLKDKARNLKLWYLKTGREVPQSLKGVTGELIKRGGARARAAFATEVGDEEAEVRKPAKNGKRSKG